MEKWKPINVSKKSGNSCPFVLRNCNTDTDWNNHHIITNYYQQPILPYCNTYFKLSILHIIYCHWYFVLLLLLLSYWYYECDRANGLQLYKTPRRISLLFFQVEILLYDISKGMAAKLGPLLLGKSAEVRTLRGVWPGVMKNPLVLPRLSQPKNE